jgi:hypothetical protein
MHAPALQVCPAPHCTLQAPQFVGLVVVSAHCPFSH